VSSGTAELAGQLGKALGGRVASVRRLSGGASRLTSAFELETEAGRCDASSSNRCGGTVCRSGPGPTWKRTSCGRRPRPGSGARRGAAGAADGLPSGWLVVERLEGRPFPVASLRRVRRRTSGADRPGGDRPGRHPHHRPGVGPRSPRRRSAAPPARVSRCAGCGTAGPRTGVRWLDHHRPHMADRSWSTEISEWATSSSTTPVCVACSTGSSPTWGPSRGHRMAVRPVLAVRWPGPGGRFRRARRVPRHLYGRRRRAGGPRAGPVVGGVRHHQMGGDLPPPGVGAPERGDPLGELAAIGRRSARANGTSST